MAPLPALAPRRLADEIVVIHPGRYWDLIDANFEAPASPAYDDTRAFVMQKLESISQAVAQNPLTHNPLTIDGHAIVEADSSEEDTETLLLQCPAAIAATETVADSPVFQSASAEVAEQLKLFQKQQSRVTALVLGAVGCACIATAGGLFIAVS